MIPAAAIIMAIEVATGQARAAASDRPRARDIGIHIGSLPTGPLNSITDVAGVLVGHATLVEGDDIRTGVTAILPHAGNVFQEKVPAAVVVGNGFGKLVGVTQVQELGVLETPIVLTNTLSVFAVADAVVEYVLALPGNESVGSINPVVGETNDGFLNDIRARRIGRDEVVAALRSARGGGVREGAIGAGMGTRCLGFKGGIGASSRRVADGDAYTVGVLVQTNFGGSLTILGAPIGRELADQGARPRFETAPHERGSCMIIVATDAPLDARQLERLGKRALIGMADAGANMSHGSGDYVVAFSTAAAVRVAHDSRAPARTMTVLHDEGLTTLFQAAREATQEAILNSLLRATTTTGHQGRTVEAVPIDRLVELCKRHGVIKE